MEMQVVKSSDEVMVRNGENEKLKYKQLCYGGGSGGGGGSTNAESLSSWPPRHYTCNFCKRRFKSAQALGGHMNIHRRARAMLRSQSISPMSSASPPSSPWLPESITSADHHFQHDEHHFIYPNPNPHWPLYTPHQTINPTSSYPSHLPMINNPNPSCSLVTITHKNSQSAAACNCKIMSDQAQYHRADELRTRERAKKSCIRAENQFNGLRSGNRTILQDDVVSRLSFGSGLIKSRPVVEEDIDLELRL